MDLGFEVAIASTFSFNKHNYKKWFKIDMNNIKTYSLFPESLSKIGTIYTIFSFHRPLINAIKHERPDLIFVDNEFYRPILRFKEIHNFKIIEYIHFPMSAFKFVDSLKISEGYARSNQLLEDYLADAKMRFIRYQSGFIKLYFKLWLKLYRKFARENPFNTADIVLANSNYIAEFVKLLWDKKPHVLYPPISIEDFKLRNIKTFEERNDSIVVISRLSPEKRIEDVIKAISLTYTKPVLKLIGGMADPSSIRYKRFLEKIAKKNNVRINFFINASRDKLVEVLTSSKIYIHPAIGEHFGISVVEGMAAGCPVVVHRSGGPYMDIVHYDKFGLSYDSVDELASYIDKLLTDKNLWKKYHEASLKRSLIFDKKNFSRNLMKIIEKY